MDSSRRSSRAQLCRHRRLHGGAAIVEAAIALPILIVVMLGAMQFGLIYQAKATLNHASLQAARIGAVLNADPAAIRRGLARGLAPLYSPDSSLGAVASTVARIDAGLSANARIRILNPTREAFADFAEDVNGAHEIPNDRLHARSTSVGAQSGVNVQDANILRVEITYGYELEVPLINGFISRTLLAVHRDATADAFERQLLRRTLLPIVSTASVRMQSPARPSSLVASLADLSDFPRVPIDSHPPDTGEADEEGEPDDDDSRHAPGGSTGRSDDSSSLGDGFFGFGEGRSDPIDPEGNGDDEGAGDDDGGDAGGGTPPGEEPPLCTPEQAGPEESDEDRGVLGRIWNELRDLASDAYDFVRGFWDGIKDQIGDLVAAIADPVETARGVYQLATAFMEDPVGTAQTIGAAIGRDLSQLVECGPYDRGRVLGNYVSPAFMLKLATKLVRFGRAGLARAAAETKRELGCASFGPETPVWSGEHRASIQSMRQGMRITSRSDRSYLDSEQAITRTLTRIVPFYHRVETESASFAVTAEHPFWVQGRGWTIVEDIEVGAPVATATGDTLILANTRVDEALQVFNLSVANTASYFVGNERVWAHNATCTIRVEYHRPRSPSNFSIGASDGGAGQWTRISRPDSDAYRYQERITGAPRGVEYNVNGVNFDGYDAQRNVLLDAKHWTQECPLGDRCRSADLKRVMADRLRVEAESQIRAVRNSQNQDTTIEWRVVDEEMALRISAILDERIDPSDRGAITVIYTPASDIVG